MAVRRFLVALVAALALVAAGSATALSPQALSPQAKADADPGPPFIDHTEWVHWGDLSSLRVYPTAAGRVTSSHFHDSGDEAWSEVLKRSPDADSPGMRDQFICHWQFAEIAQPGKTSWNLEPWRPVVDYDTMVDDRCNPGGTEEPF